MPPETRSDSTNRPVVIIDSSEVREGKLGDLRTAMNDLVRFVEVKEPGIIAYNVYFNEEGTRMTVFQVHPDSLSAEFHMKTAGAAFPGFSELIQMSGIDIYGTPDPDLLDRMQLKARMLGSGMVAVHQLHAGFDRFKIQERAGLAESGRSKKFIARAEVRIHAPLSRVWDALVNPAIIRHYMFGTQVVSDWKKGSPITWTGEWEGKHYEDRGVILQLEPERILRYSHFSPLSGLPDVPENYHAVAIELSGEAEYTRVSLSQNNNPTEQARDHSQKNWEMMLSELKKVVESDPVQRLFAEYEKAFAALDIEKNAEFFADTFISAGPRGAIAQSKAEFLRLAHQAAEFYTSVGQTSARILSLQETMVSNEYSMVRVHWGVTFRKTGTTLIEFDVSYLVQKTGPEPKIILFIAHQDEEKAMKDLGLLPAADRAEH